MQIFFPYIALLVIYITLIEFAKYFKRKSPSAFFEHKRFMLEKLGKLTCVLAPSLFLVGSGLLLIVDFYDINAGNIKKVPNVLVVGILSTLIAMAYVISVVYFAKKIYKGNDLK